jgi:4-aminobutyrate aminotransferase/(S)-3-amino-2-methylpropionate transaminase
MPATQQSSNAAMFERRASAIARGVGHITQVVTAKARNAEMWDVEGRRYIDFAGGIAVLNTGHCHPTVIAAVQEQLTKYSHTCFHVTANEPYILLAERLNALAPISGPVKSALFTTGAEAVENAIKVARAATGRPGVIAFTGAFHGRTLMAMSLTGKVNPYKKNFGAPQPNVWHVPFPGGYHNISVEETLRHLDFLFAADVHPEQIAAIIIEPVQGEGGFNIAPPALMRALRETCDRHGIVFIADEVQTGYGRTGKMFAMEHYGVEPDLITVAKSLAGGFPLSGVVGRAAVLDAADPGALGGTYAGNPVACAAALAVLEVFEREKLLDRANAIGKRIVDWLKTVQIRNDAVPISGIRGLGAMIAFDICREPGGHEPDPDLTAKVLAKAHRNGLILLSCGTAANTIRILVPLTVEEEVLDEGLDILTTALTN